MGRTYAGILGPIAFAVVVARCLASRGSVLSALYAAPLALFAFAFIGYIIGNIAERTIVEAIEAKFHAKLRAEEAANTATSRGDTP
jgi:hypothetical protein